MASPFCLSQAPSALQPLHLDRRDGAVGFGANVEQEVAVLADDVDEQRDQFAGSDGFILAFGAVVAEGAAEAAALLPFLLADLVQSSRTRAR